MLATPPVTFAKLHSNLPSTPSEANMGTLITGGVSNTKGLFSAGQLIAATTYDTYMIEILFGNTFASTTATDTLLDIGVGASGSESVIVSNLQVGWSKIDSIMLPLFIPAGTRIAARVQGQVASQTCAVAVFCHQGPSGIPWPTFSVCDAYGADTTNSDGFEHTPGASGTPSTWTNLGSTLSRNYGAIFPMVQSNADTSLTAQTQHWELGISSTALATWLFRTESDERWYGPFPSMPYLCSLVSGTQLMVRATSSGTAEAESVVAYCLA